MAGSKLSALSALTDVTLSDLMHLLDASETVDASKNKQVTLGTLLHALRLVSAIGTVDEAADGLLAIDADGLVVGTIVINTLQLAASQIASGTLSHERGGIEADISGVLIGDVLAGTASGTIGIVAASGKSDGDVLTIQSDGSVD